jgi:hypothetical protein
MERFEWGHYYSNIVEEYPDKKIFPRFYKARKLEYILEPGDMLWIPPGWYHWIFSEDPDPETGLNIAVNYWYNSSWDITDIDRGNPVKTTHSIRNYREFLNSFSKKRHIVSRSEKKIFSLEHNMWRHGDYLDYECTLMTLDEFVDKKDPCTYLSSLDDPRLLQFDPKIYDSWKCSAANWWINFGHVSTVMHFDRADNLFCQVEGRRRVVLFPHSEWPNLYLLNPYPPEFIKKVIERGL